MDEQKGKKPIICIAIAIFGIAGLEGLSSAIKDYNTEDKTTYSSTKSTSSTSKSSSKSSYSKSTKNKSSKSTEYYYTSTDKYDTEPNSKDASYYTAIRMKQANGDSLSMKEIQFKQEYEERFGRTTK